MESGSGTAPVIRHFPARAGDIRAMADDDYSKLLTSDGDFTPECEAALVQLYSLILARIRSLKHTHVWSRWPRSID